MVEDLSRMLDERITPFIGNYRNNKLLINNIYCVFCEIMDTIKDRYSYGYEWESRVDYSPGCSFIFFKEPDLKFLDKSHLLVFHLRDNEAHVNLFDTTQQNDDEYLFYLTDDYFKSNIDINSFLTEFLLRKQKKPLKSDL